MKQKISNFLKKFSGDFALKNKDTFKNAWRNINSSGSISEDMKKAKLSAKELANIRRDLKNWKKEGLDTFQRQEKLQDRKKLKEDWKAERVLRNEEKRMETKEIKWASKKKGYNLFVIYPSYNACKLCRDFTNDGHRIFTEDELKVKGRNVPPLHVQCNCFLAPYKKQ